MLDFALLTILCAGHLTDVGVEILWPERVSLRRFKFYTNSPAESGSCRHLRRKIGPSNFKEFVFHQRDRPWDRVHRQHQHC